MRRGRLVGPIFACSQAIQFCANNLCQGLHCKPKCERVFFLTPVQLKCVMCCRPLKFHLGSMVGAVILLLLQATYVPVGINLTCV